MTASGGKGAPSCGSPKASISFIVAACLVGCRTLTEAGPCPCHLCPRGLLTGHAFWLHPRLEWFRERRCVTVPRAALLLLLCNRVWV